MAFDGEHQKSPAVTAGPLETTVNVEEPTRDVSGDIIDDGLRRGLKGRQFVIIALGSIIGPACLYGMGYGIYEAGPVGLLIGFVIIGISMWLLMQSVGEVATLFPVHGGFIEVCASLVEHNTNQEVLINALSLSSPSTVADLWIPPSVFLCLGYIISCGVCSWPVVSVSWLYRNLCFCGYTQTIC